CGEKTAEKWLISTFSALSPLICREIAWRAYGDCDARPESVGDGGEALKREFFNLMEKSKGGVFEPWGIINEDGSPRDFSYTQIMQYESALEMRRAESFSQMLESHYTKTAQLNRLRQRFSATQKTVKSARERILRKLAAQQSDLEKTAQRDIMRECGDLITANLYQMEKGESILVAQDYFAPEGGVREIALDPLKSPQQNAAKYYKDYNKAKTAEKYLTEQIRVGQVEAEYLESVLEAISMAEGERDMEEIRRELASSGYVREKKVKGGKVKSPPAAEPMRFISSTGMQILAGKNNVQNDQLTLKSALKSDVWLHTQKIHGSHVIISCGGAEPDERTLFEAAAIAAYYSAARQSGKVPVDYTQVRNVKKASGGRPGMVIYVGNKTVMAVPDEKLVESLRV
ncbi:MAG: NFACT family protein, partial [Oscillospiraceae bacterium]|nr:NFACT family protein [Oscillospiraceae bacterium]